VCARVASRASVPGRRRDTVGRKSAGTRRSESRRCSIHSHASSSFATDRSLAAPSRSSSCSSARSEYKPRWFSRRWGPAARRGAARPPRPRSRRSSPSRRRRRSSDGLARSRRPRECASIASRPSRSRGSHRSRTGGRTGRLPGDGSRGSGPESRGELRRRPRRARRAGEPSRSSSTPSTALRADGAVDLPAVVAVPRARRPGGTASRRTWRTRGHRAPVLVDDLDTVVALDCAYAGAGSSASPSASSTSR
jgi:hypothetical protein